MKTDRHILPQVKQQRGQLSTATSHGFAENAAGGSYWTRGLFGFCCTLIIVMTIILSGCMSKSPNLNQELAYTNQSYPESVAILPFKNNTQIEGIESFVRATFYSHMSVLPYHDVELSLVDKNLAACNFFGYESVEDIPLTELGYLLGVDAVIFGEVTEYQKVFMGIYSQMAVAVKISVWDTRSGHEVWNDECVSRNHEGGLPLGILDIPFIFFRSSYHLRDASKVRAVDDVARQLAGRIPVPAGMKAVGKQVDNSADDPKPSEPESLKKLTRVNPDEIQGSNKQSLKRLTKR